MDGNEQTACPADGASPAPARVGRRRKALGAGCLTALALASGVWLWRQVPDRDGGEPRGEQVRRLTCDEPLRDVGEVGVPQAEHAFELRNASAAPLHIVRIGRSCGCMQLELGKKTLDPGESATINVSVEINPKKPGALTRFHEQAAIHIKEQPDQPLLLDLTGTYIPPLYYLVHQVGMEAPARLGGPFQGKLELFLNKDRGVDITAVEGHGPLEFTTAIGERAPVGDGGYERVDILIGGTFNAGELPAFGGLTVRTNSADVPEVSMRVVLRAAPSDRATYYPERIAFGVIGDGAPVTREVVFHLASDSGYQVTGTAASQPGIRVEAGPLKTAEDGKSVAVRCTFDPAGISGAVEDLLSVELADDDRTISYSIPISAFVNPPAAP